MRNRALRQATKPQPVKRERCFAAVGYSSKIKEQETLLYAKQKRFCEEYLVKFDFTQAAIRAGYSPKIADIMLLNIPTRPYFVRKGGGVL